MDKVNLQKDFRYEKKFIIQDLEPSEIYHLIKHNSAMFSEIFYSRRINNIYFDSINFKNYHEHLNGISQRIKIRVRWFGKTFGLIENPILEFKMKDGYLGEKRRFKLKPFILDKKICFKSLQKDIFEKSNLPAEIIEIIKMSKPTLLNSYKRKYFASVNKKIVITTDKDLIFYKIKENHNNFIEKILDKNLQILELKYSAENDDEASKITQEFPFRITAISKYIQGIDFLNL